MYQIDGVEYVYSITRLLDPNLKRGGDPAFTNLLEGARAVVDALPENVRNSARVMPLGEALLQVHFPDSQDKLNAARERLAFDADDARRREPGAGGFPLLAAGALTRRVADARRVAAL